MQLVNLNELRAGATDKSKSIPWIPANENIILYTLFSGQQKKSTRSEIHGVFN